MDTRSRARCEKNTDHDLHARGVGVLQTRQQIRKKMETWVVQNEVKKAQDAANATWKKRWQTVA